MPVYVDELVHYPSKPFGYDHWCHMVADTLEELHEMARKIGMKPAWFQKPDRHPHYDLTQSKRKLAIKHGAIELDPNGPLGQTIRIVRRCLKNQDKTNDISAGP